MTATFNFALEKATRDRDNFLKEHPELQSLQDDLREAFDAFEDDPVANMEIILNAIQVRHKKIMMIKEEVDNAIKAGGLCSDTTT